MLTDILEINQAGMLEMYDFTIQNNGNIIIFGPAGIGKTEAAIQTIEKYNLSPCYVNLTVLEAPDLAGLPSFKDGKTVYSPPEYLPWLTDNPGPPVTLLLDEIDKAANELQNTLLELLQFHSIQGKKLNIKGIICTGNLPDERAFSRKLSHALTNRCSIYKLKCEFKPWRKWAVQSNLNPLIVSFLQSNQNLLLQKESSDDPTAYCSPSPRSWSLAAKDLDKIDSEQLFLKFKESYDKDPKDLEEAFNDYLLNFKTKIIAGRVGYSTALKLKTWISYTKDLEPIVQEILSTGKCSDILTSDKQVICATMLLTSMKENFKNLNNSKKIELTDKVFGWMLDNMSPSYIFGSIKSTISNDFSQEHNLLESNKFEEVVDIIHEIATSEI